MASRGGEESTGGGRERCEETGKSGYDGRYIKYVQGQRILGRLQKNDQIPPGIEGRRDLQLTEVLLQKTLIQVPSVSDLGFRKQSQPMKHP